MINWILDNNVIIQTVLSILSLIATMAVSIVIYWLQSRHEREIEHLQEKQRLAEIRNRANEFLIDNEAEKDYLPWCVLASSLHRHEKHTRKIYTDFCRCSDELQNEILKMANFEFATIPHSEWINKAIDSLCADIEEHKLGRDILYDGAKYFHYSFRRYKGEPWTNATSVEIFEPISLDLSVSSFYRKRMFNLGDYIVEYFHFLYSEKRLPIKTNNPMPPIDYLCNLIDFENEQDETLVCAWVMELVETISIVIHNIKYTEKTTTAPLLEHTDAQIVTYEDKYYNALQALYNTYYEIDAVESKKKKQKRVKEKRKSSRKKIS